MNRKDFQSAVVPLTKITSVAGSKKIKEEENSIKVPSYLQYGDKRGHMFNTQNP